MFGLIQKNDLPSDTFDWGIAKWLVTPDQNEDTGFTVGELVIFPGAGHERHNHDGSDELLFFLSGQGMQTVDDGAPFPVGAGDAIFLKDGMYHSTMNVGWDPMRILAIYCPGGQEKTFKDLPDYLGLAGGLVQKLVRG
jgi:oxalate decarboxylase/phosphoglucose isomerase-like protein (cupin superfamily)